MLFAHSLDGNALINADQGLPYLIGGVLNSPIVLIVHDGFARIAAPFLGLLSGYFFATNLSSRSYFNVLVSRLRTLYLPVVLWSAIFAGVQLAAAYAVADPDIIARTWNKLDANSFLGLSRTPLDAPLHYLVDLVKCILFAPVAIYLLDRVGRSVFIVVIGVIFLMLIGADLRGGTPGQNGASVLPRADLFVFFFFGLFVHRLWNGDIRGVLRRFSVANKPALVFLGIAFVLGALHWRWMVASSDDFAAWGGALVLMATRITGSLLVLAALKWITQLGDQGYVVDDKQTFLLFTTHFITFFIMKNVIEFVLGHELSENNHLVTFFVFPFLAVGAAYVLYRFQTAMFRNFRVVPR